MGSGGERVKKGNRWGEMCGKQAEMKRRKLRYSAMELNNKLLVIGKFQWRIQRFSLGVRRHGERRRESALVSVCDVGVSI